MEKTGQPGHPLRRPTRPPVEELTSRQSHDPSAAADWTVDDSVNLYRIDRWSNGYFGISQNGNLVVRAPQLRESPSVAMVDIIDGLKQRGLNMPVMLRVENLLTDRITKLNEAFASAIDELNYRGSFRGVYPIKVNQQMHVVTEIARFGERYGHGLEAGSKAELLIAMSVLKSDDGLIICNGYKDQEFVDLGLQARLIGMQCFFVIETPDELDLIIERSRHWEIRPLVGVRLKLSTKIQGHWAEDSGDRSLFGLTTVQLINVVDTLKAADMLDCLQMVHFHLGSQIPNIRNIRNGVSEACRYYIELAREGAPLGYIDLGGGLAVDYDGSASTQIHSRNYDLNEYCVDIVEAVMESLDPHGIEHPVLVTESGRWTVAPMSVLLFNVLAVNNFEPESLPELAGQQVPEQVSSLLETLNSIDPQRLQENYNDAIYYRDQMRAAFGNGEISLRQRALAENTCLTILNRISQLVPKLKRPPADLVNLSDSLSDIYLGNFSVFQSLPDAWAIDQIFPAMPVQRLNQKPTRRAIIADLTCDCDGKLDHFGGEIDDRRAIALHEIQPGEEYYIGVFLVGSYQETLGDLHNLFGDTNVASVRIDENGELEFVHELEGDSISDVLSYVEYQPQEMHAHFRKTAEAAVRDRKITIAQRQQMLSLFLESLRGYTYFES